MRCALVQLFAIVVCVVLFDVVLLDRTARQPCPTTESLQDDLIELAGRLPEARTTKLLTIGRAYGTDKVTRHAYHRPYGLFLDRPPQKILEIGISQGASIKTWLAYFPEAEVHGMDLHDSRRNWGIADGRFQKWIGSMTNRTFLRWFVQQHGQTFDLIIDDGARNSNQVAWEELFGPALRDGGMYIIEDVGEGYQKNGPKVDATTQVAKQWIDVIHSQYGGQKRATSPYLTGIGADEDIEGMWVSDQFILLRKRIGGPVRNALDS